MKLSKCATKWKLSQPCQEYAASKDTLITRHHVLHLSTISAVFQYLCLTKWLVGFTAHHKTVLNGMCIVPSVMVALTFQKLKDKAFKLADLYKYDLPSFDSIQGEIHNWKTKWQQHSDTHGKASLPASPASALQHASCMFVNIHSLLEILCTLPVTSCSSECSHSSLKLIKTSILSTMENERLSGLAFLYIH